MADDITLDDHLPQIMAALNQALAEAVAETARGIASEYRVTAPRATGYMADSAYVVTHDASTYNGGGPDDLPMVEAPSSPLEAIAAIAASYAAYVEYGTIHEASQPAFHPAFDHAARTLKEALSHLEDAIAGAGITG